MRSRSQPRSPTGRRLQRAVEETNGVYQIGFVLRYGDWVEQIRELTPRLGSPLQINVEVYDERLNPADLLHLARIQSFIKNSSAMTHEGSHVIDYVSLWNPSPWTRVSSVAQQTSPIVQRAECLELADRACRSLDAQRQSRLAAAGDSAFDRNADRARGARRIQLHHRQGHRRNERRRATVRVAAARPALGPAVSRLRRGDRARPRDLRHGV